MFASEGLWPGQSLKIGCIQRLWQKSVSPNVLLERIPVEGSLIAIDALQNPIRILEHIERKLKLESRESTFFVSYRPWLDVQVTHFTLYTQEWNLKTGWRLEVEES